MKKEAIILRLKKSTASILASVKQSKDYKFQTPPMGKWTISEQIDHLLRSIQPLNKALRIPLPGLRILFGKAVKPSRSFDEMLDEYHKALDNGAKASGRYIPSKIGNPELVVKNYEKQSDTLYKTINSWKESDLDKYCLPHPFLGKLNIREMLYFTVFHTEMHGNRINQLLLN